MYYRNVTYHIFFLYLSSKHPSCLRLQADLPFTYFRLTISKNSLWEHETPHTAPKPDLSLLQVSTTALQPVPPHQATARTTDFNSALSG